MNLFVYVGNQPTVKTDPLGLWIGWIHNEITKIALDRSGLYCCKFAAGLPDDVAAVDYEEGFQNADHSYYHAMVNGKSDPSGKAQDITNYYDLIGNRWKSCDKKDIRRALHAVQDSYAPAHRDFQPWYGGIYIVNHIGKGEGDVLDGVE
jgi:hypothetical protein